SSRRRHTIFSRDWSSDVCSSDLSGRSGISTEDTLLKEWPESGPKLVWQAEGAGRGYASAAIADGRVYTLGDGSSLAADDDEYLRSEERRVGKGGRARRSRCPKTK